MSSGRFLVAPCEVLRSEKILQIFTQREFEFMGVR